MELWFETGHMRLSEQNKISFWNQDVINESYAM